MSTLRSQLFTFISLVQLNAIFSTFNFKWNDRLFNISQTYQNKRFSWICLGNFFELKTLDTIYVEQLNFNEFIFYNDADSNGDFSSKIPVESRLWTGDLFKEIVKNINTLNYRPSIFSLLWMLNNWRGGFLSNTFHIQQMFFFLIWRYTE